jgi:broad specificity phosphatase PhoE
MTSPVSRRRLIMVRHGRVADCYDGVCYGRSDIELGEEGRRQSLALAEELARLPITHLMHSGLERARWLAELIGARTALTACVAPALAEFNFGQWELRPWQAILQEVGEQMAELTRSPSTFRPPLGETVHEMRDRVLAWYRDLPEDGLIVAVAHGGTIAALRGSLAGCPPHEWPALIPGYGQWIEIDESSAVTT